MLWGPAYQESIAFTSAFTSVYAGSSAHPKTAAMQATQSEAQAAVELQAMQLQVEHRCLSCLLVKGFMRVVRGVLRVLE